ncbi:hypothetical protein C8R46DRAFT_498307 [Mycena filopes]|nr:hypothetical protein C8R46DRAFT_498307 [Mycena filopes]
MPLLPIELQREIFEMAIRTSYKDAVVKLNLSLVAHHVHFWVDQVFYESVEISNSAEVAPFFKLVNSKPAGFFTTAVKALSLYYISEPDLDRVLAICPRIQLLSCALLLPLPPRLNSLPLRRLCLDMPKSLAEIMNTGSAAEPAWCSTLTHLDLGFTRLPFDMQMVPMLSRLPGLTNFALHTLLTNRPLANAVCTSCPNLRVLVLYSMGDDEHAAVEYRDAPKVVVVNADFLQEWDTSVQGLPDFWTEAESVVAGRKR